MKLENYVLPVGVIVITAFIFQHSYYSGKLETAEKAFQICEAVITPAQRKEIRDEMDYQNDMADLEHDRRDYEDQDRY